MTRDEYVTHHAKRVMKGGPRPSVSQVERDLQCGSHIAHECLERMMNVAVSGWMRVLSPRPNPEPVPEWMR